jgi:hypothetical protein
MPDVWMPSSGWVGRERELRALESLLDEVSSSGGRAAMLVGEPGIGKTVWRGSSRRSTDDFFYSWLGIHAIPTSVTQGLRGRRVQCRVTASNGAGAAAAVSRSLRIR